MTVSVTAFIYFGISSTAAGNDAIQLFGFIGRDVQGVDALIYA